MTGFRIAFLAACLLVAPLGFAQSTYTTGFEPPDFALGDVNGQNGWGHLGNSPTGGTIVVAPAGPPLNQGAQSLEVFTRNAGFFGVANHLFSALVDPAAGETGSTIGGAVVPNPHSQFEASFWFRTPSAPLISSRADGRFAELNPSSKGVAAGDAANRYAQVRLSNSTNTAAGLVRVEIGWFTSTSFLIAPVGTLNWGEWYRFDYLIHLVDGTDGVEPNDRFSLTIRDAAGTVIGTACGSTWELPWRTGSFGGSATPRGVNGFDFWSVSGPTGTVAGHIDNFTMTTLTPAPLAVTVSGNATVCTGATTTLTANPSGGTSPYTAYAWRDAANTIVGAGPTLVAGAGTYTVTVTDATCGTVTSAAFAVTGMICKVTPTVTWSDPADIVYGTPLSATQLNATASVPGTFTYTPPAGTVLGAGPNQILSVDFSPSDTTNFNDVNGTTVRINVLPATPIVTLTGTTFTYDASPHAANAVARDASGNAVSGSFTFTYDGSPTPPTNAGTYSVVATFTSSDPNFTNATGTGTLTIQRRPTTTTVIGVSPSPSTAGEPVTVSFTVGGTIGSATGSVLVSDGSFSCTAPLPASSCTLTFPNEGGRTITASYSGDANHLPSTSSGVAHSVGPEVATASLDGSAFICAGDSATLRVSLTGLGPWTITWSDGLVENVSSPIHLRTVRPSSTTLYSISSVTDGNGAGVVVGAAQIFVKVVTPPAILDSPRPEIGQTLTLRATAGYSSYQWFRNGVAIPGATSSQLTIGPVTQSDFGAYTVAGTQDGCTSAASAAYSLVPLASPVDDAVIPVVGNTPGVNAALFRTTIHLVNATTEVMQGELSFIDRSLPVYPYTLAAGETQFIDDLLPVSFSGLTSIDVRRLRGPLPVAVVHVFNEGGERGTSGMIERIIPSGSALSVGERAVLVAPIDPVATRFNVGLRSLTQGLIVRIVRRTPAGAVAGTTERALPPSTLLHISAAALMGSAVGGGDSLTFEILQGSGVIYGAATDNATNDPNMQIAARVMPRTPSGRFILPVAGAVSGAFASRFATGLQIHNPADEPMTLTVTFHPANATGSANDPQQMFTMAARATLSMSDVVDTLGASGMGSLDIATPAAVRPVLLARIYSIAGTSQTSASMEPVPEEDVLIAGDEAVLAAPHAHASSRFNIGIRTLGNGVRLTAIVRNAAGIVIRTVSLSFPANYFGQEGANALLGTTFVSDESVVFRIEQGSAVIYGVWTDNVSQDPALQYAMRP